MASTLPGFLPINKKEALALIQDFRTFQEERSRQHHALTYAHKVYLATGQATGGQNYDLESYKLKVKEITDKFKSISQKIIEIAKKLEDLKEENEKIESVLPIALIRQVQVHH